MSSVKSLTQGIPLIAGAPRAVCYVKLMNNFKYWALFIMEIDTRTVIVNTFFEQGECWVDKV